MFSLISQRAYALNLGSIVKNNYVVISNQESEKVKMLFWNIDENSYTVRLTASDIPENWIVIIDPHEFVLNKTTGEEYISLPDVNEQIRAKVVNIFIKPDNNSKQGKYFIIIRAETLLPQSEINGINFIPERLYKIEVDLKEIFFSNETERENKMEISGNHIVKNGDIKKDNMPDKFANKEYFYLSILFLISFASIILYKKY